jgi:AcrR family transcriptional regulator
MSSTASAKRLSPEARRAAVVDAAFGAFARGGLHGTSTDDIARAAGISQPYLFKIFGTKKQLFLACIEEGFRRTRIVMEQAAAGVEGEQIFHEMGKAYVGMLEDRRLLLSQLQAYAACDDTEVQETVRRCFGDLWTWVERVSGADEERVREFFSIGMLINVQAAMDLPGMREAWAERCLGGKP